MLGSVKCGTDMGHYGAKEGGGETGRGTESGGPRMSAMALGFDLS